MDIILVAYIGLMTVGILWVFYRSVVFVRNQKDRERRWGGDVLEAELAAFIEEFKRHHEKRDVVQEPASTGNL